MKAAKISSIKSELYNLSNTDLIDLVLKLSKFKKENKELLSYLLFLAQEEDEYIKQVKYELNLLFEQMNTNSYFYMKKTIRKILRNITKYAKYSKKTKTEIELRIWCCQKIKTIQPSIANSNVLFNIYQRELSKIEKLISKLHEDYHLDYEEDMDSLEL